MASSSVSFKLHESRTPILSTLGLALCCSAQLTEGSEQLTEDSEPYTHLSLEHLEHWVMWD